MNKRLWMVKREINEVGNGTFKTDCGGNERKRMKGGRK